MKSKRNIFLGLTILAFLITAPIVTLYTAGYRYHFKKQRFERVGFFETSSVPSGATVLLNGTQVGKTPYVDMGILPGHYSLELTRAGYREFSTEFDIRSGLSTLLLNTLLWKDSAPVLIADTALGAVLDPTGTSVAWTETIPDGTAAMISLLNGEKRRLGCVLRAGEDARILWNESGRAVLVTVKTASGLDGCVATMTGNSYALSESLGTSSGRATSVAWSPFDDSHLLVQTASADLVIAYERNETKTVSPSPIPFTIRGSKMYGVKDEALFSQSLTSMSLSFGTTSVPVPAGSYTFLPSPEAYLVLREARHGRIDVFETKSLKRLATVVADSVVFEPGSKSKRFLALNGYELSLYDMEGETSRLITRYSEPITAAIWHPLGSHALIVVDGRVVALPFDRSAEEAITLAEFGNVHGLWIDARGNALLILGTEEATGVWKLDLKD